MICRVFTGGGQCLPSGAISTDSMCNGIITYSYFIPYGLSLEDLTKRVNSDEWLGNSTFSTLSTNCLQSMKQMICQQVYKECSGMVMADVTTWNKAVYGSVYPLPFYRPCRSICSAVTSACESFALSLGPWWPDCEGKEDYSNGAYSNGSMAHRFIINNPSEPKCTLFGETGVFYSILN